MPAPRLKDGQRRVQWVIALDPKIFRAVSNIAVREDRSVSHVIERLLRQNPQVAEGLRFKMAKAA